jgi:ElaB/YqjD/DUF883 family membrane-anchored ribosome-binding protein
MTNAPTTPTPKDIASAPGTSSQSSDASSCHSGEDGSKVTKTLDELRAGAADLIQRSSEALNQQSEKLHAQSTKVRESALEYVRQEPIKALLIASGVGAAFVLLGNWICHRGKR